MTMKDRHILHEVLRSSYRMQERNDLLAKRRSGVRKKKDDQAAFAHAELERVAPQLEDVAKSKPSRKMSSKESTVRAQEDTAAILGIEAAKPNGAAVPAPDENGGWALRCEKCGTEVRYGSEPEARVALAIHRDTEGTHNLTVVELEPRLVAKGVTGPLGRLVNGQRFFVAGAVGDFILEGWTHKPGAFDAEGELKKIPVVRQITQRRTTTKKEETLKPVTMSAWFEETICTVIEDFALLNPSVSGTIQSAQEEQGGNMANKKAKTKKSAAKKTNGAGRGPQFGSDAMVKRVKGPNDEQIKRHVTILTCLKEAGDKLTLGALGKALAKASGTKQDGEKVVRMHLKALTDGGFISVTPATA